MAIVTSIIKDLKAMEPADIDVDFAHNPITGKSKDTIIEYLQEKYGKNHVCHVGNRNTYALKSIIIALGKIYSIDSQTMYSASKATDNNLSVAENIMNSDEVATYFGSHPELKGVAEKMLGLTSAYAVHAGGVVISNQDLTQNVPMQRSTGGAVVSMWNKDEMAAMGYNKLDLLGSSTAGIMHIGKKLAGLDPYEEVPFDDPEVFRDVVLGVKNQNIFQFESNLGRQAFLNLKPMTVMELANASGVIRFLGSEVGRIAYEKYQDNVEQFQMGEQDHWLMKLREEVHDDKHFEIAAELLEPTYGVILYQEQLSELVHRISDGEMTLTDGNQFRKKLDKFRAKNGLLESVQGNKESITKWHKGFMEIMNQYIVPYLGKDGLECVDQDVVDFLNFKVDKKGYLPFPKSGIVSWCITFLAYAFNLLHAMAYTITSYTTMWLKHYYPLEFWTASLISDYDKFDKIKSYIRAMKKECGVKLLPPDINKSDALFKIEDGKIRYGLGSIKGLGKSAVEIVESRGDGYTSVEDFEKKVNRRIVNKRVVENLMYINAFSEFGDVKEVYDQLCIPIKNLDPLDASKDTLVSKEQALIGVNASFLDEMYKKAESYPPITDFEDGDTDVFAIKVLKTITKQIRNGANKGKNYYFHTCECLNSFEQFNLYNFDSIEIPLDKGYMLNLSKRGDFISIYKKRKRW